MECPSETINHGALCEGPSTDGLQPLYALLRWAWAKRVQVIRDTYKFIQNQGGFLGEAMGIQGGLVLAALKPERGQKALIRVGSDPQFRKKGEIGVILELEGIPGPVTGSHFPWNKNPEDHG